MILFKVDRVMTVTEKLDTLVEFSGEDYHVVADMTAATVTFQGRLRLRGVREYAPLVHLLNNLAEQKPSLITLDFRELSFLNSSGLDMLLKFIIRVRKLKTINVTVLLTQQHPWQTKSLKNLQRLMPNLKSEIT